MVDRTLVRVLQAQRIVTGLFFLVAGLIQFFAMGIPKLTLLFMQLSLPFPSLLAWLIPLVECVCGIAIICNYRLRHTVWPLILISLCFAFTLYWYGPGSSNGSPNWIQILMQGVLVLNLLVFALSARN